MAEERRVEQGQRLSGALSHRTLNTMVELTRQQRLGRLGQQGGEAFEHRLGQGLEVIVQNSTGTFQPVGSVLSLLQGTPLDPANDPLDFQRRPCFYGSVPLATDDVVGVLRDGLGPDECGLAIVEGLAVVTLNWTDTAQEYAVPVVGDSSQMESAAGGHRILWTETASTGQQQAVVFLERQGITIDRFNDSTAAVDQAASVSTIHFSGNAATGDQFYIASETIGGATYSVVRQHEANWSGGAGSGSGNGRVGESAVTWKGEKTFRNTAIFEGVGNDIVHRFGSVADGSAAQMDRYWQLGTDYIVTDLFNDGMGGDFAGFSQSYTTTNPGFGVVWSAPNPNDWLGFNASSTYFSGSSQVVSDLHLAGGDLAGPGAILIGMYVDKLNGVYFYISDPTTALQYAGATGTGGGGDTVRGGIITHLGTAPAATMTVGSSAITSGTSGGVLWNNAGTLANTAGGSANDLLYWNGSAWAPASKIGGKAY